MQEHTLRRYVLILSSLTVLLFVSVRSGAQEHSLSMTSALSPPLPMQRDGSGTSWLPDSSPLHVLPFRFEGWDAMVHGNVFLRYTNQDAGNSGTRGGEEIGAPNWVMAMAKRPLEGTGHLMLRTMISFDPVTEGDRGYPLLLQTGETAKGRRLIDRQHPHDFLGELAIAYSQTLGRNSGCFFYCGLPGEPALGPPVYLHRPSAVNNPDAPLGHHWQDATHISFGVLTAGFRHGPFKVDGSLFNGREPDENRFSMDTVRLDSYSFRLSMNPSPDTALQVSHGYLRSPEVLEPGIDVRRTTASVLWNYPVSSATHLALSFVWGANKPDTRGAQHSFLVEADYRIGDLSLFSRAELVRKSAEELGVESIGKRLFSVGAVSLGAAKGIINYKKVFLSLGFLGTVFGIDRELRPVYGRMPFSVEVFLRVSPGMMRRGHSAKGVGK